MEVDIIMSDILLKACEECVADRGKEDDELVQRLHDFIHGNYEEKGAPWNYTLIDAILDAWEKEVEFRDLDGVYFRIERDNKWQSICFSDLNEVEMVKVLEGKDEEWLKRLCKILGQTLREVGDHFNIVRGTREEE
jgi:hypothetical protein